MGWDEERKDFCIIEASSHFWLTLHPVYIHHPNCDLLLDQLFIVSNSKEQFFVIVS